MTPFQKYADSRWQSDFPQWSHLREYLADGHDRAFIRYVVPSPGDPANVLYVVFSADDIEVKFAVPGSHEHYDPDLYSSDDGVAETVNWDQAYSDALDEYVKPLLDDKLFAVWYDGGAALVPNVKEFAEMNGLHACRFQSWSTPSAELRATSLG